MLSRMIFTIYSNQLFDQKARLCDQPLAEFSSHSAAFEASCRLRQPDWLPLGGASHMSASDVLELERLRMSLQ